MKKFISAWLLFCITVGNVSAQTNLKLDQFIDSVYKSFNNKSSPGLAVTILQNGKHVTKKLFGLTSV